MKTVKDFLIDLVKPRKTHTIFLCDRDGIFAINNNAKSKVCPLCKKDCPTYH